MADNDWRWQLPLKVRISQITVGAMGFGCLCFLVIAVVATQTQAKAADHLNLTYLALLIAAVAFGIWCIVPPIVVSKGRNNILQKLYSVAKTESPSPAGDKKESENSKALMLIDLLLTKILVGSAILEGAVFFLLFVYMAEHSMLSIAAAVVLLVLLISQMPACNRAAIWVEDQLRLMDG